MLIRDCMTKEVEVADPMMSLREVAQKMRDGDFGVLPVCENDRLIGMITDRDIVTRAIAMGLSDPRETKVREVLSEGVLYCYEDQTLDEVSRSMGENQVRRLPVLNRQKRLVGIVSVGDLALSRAENLEDTLSRISRHQHNETRIHYHL